MGNNPRHEVDISIQKAKGHFFGRNCNGCVGSTFPWLGHGPYNSSRNAEGGFVSIAVAPIVYGFPDFPALQSALPL
jgi:hypothetical protein